MASAPFTIQNCVCIRGGFGNKALFLECEKGEANTPHSEAQFIALTSSNKVLMTKLVPKQEVPRFNSGHLKTFPDQFIKHMQKLRNAAVDQLLMQHLYESIPWGITLRPRVCRKTQIGWNFSKQLTSPRLGMGTIWQVFAHGHFSRTDLTNSSAQFV